MAKRKNTMALTPGDVVARSVTDGQGNVLIHEGVEVTKTLIRVLERRGVEAIHIRDEIEDATAKVDAVVNQVMQDPMARQRLTEMRERLNVGFQAHVGNVTMAVLYKCVLDYLTGKIGRQAAAS